MWEVLEQHPSVTMPFQHFLELCPRLQPRFYTISSSSKRDPLLVGITCSLAVQRKSRGRTALGVCSSYLRDLAAGKDKVCIFIRPSSFRLPPKLAAPMLLVGPGTGLAPFHAFVEEEYALRLQRKKKALQSSSRALLQAQSDDALLPADDSNDPRAVLCAADHATRVLGPMTLYFGCRNSEVGLLERHALACVFSFPSLPRPFPLFFFLFVRYFVLLLLLQQRQRLR
jgi:hypothetical protein